MYIYMYIYIYLFIYVRICACIWCYIVHSVWYTCLLYLGGEQCQAMTYLILYDIVQYRYIYIYIYVYVCTHTYIYIYIYMYHCSTCYLKLSLGCRSFNLWQYIFDQPHKSTSLSSMFHACVHSPSPDIKNLIYKGQCVLTRGSVGVVAQGM